MKKNTKRFLIGVGATFAGFAAYVFLKESKRIYFASEKKDVTDDPVPPVDATTFNKEYIEHRKELIKERAEKKIDVSAVETPSIPISQESVDSIKEYAEFSDEQLERNLMERSVRAAESPVAEGEMLRDVSMDESKTQAGS